MFSRVVYASGWTVVGYAISMAARFAGNVLLTRLLFPEAFGLMAIVQAVLIGITMMSDLGIEQAIIQSASGHKEEFINTAWSVQATRGVLIWIASWAVAWPVAALYKHPELFWLMPAIGCSAFVGGLASTKLVVASRNLGIAKVTIIEIVTSLAGLLTMIALAWETHSVWALVIGNLAGAVLKTLASHYWIEGTKNYFTWDAGAILALRNFGRWIFLGTAVAYLVGEGMRLLMAGLLNVRDLAFYSLALSLSSFPLQIVQQIGSRVLFPAYSEIVRDRPERLGNALFKSRVVQIVPYWLVSLSLVYFGRLIVGVLYDDRYSQVAWFLEVLALGSLPQSITVSYGSVLIAKGLVRTSTLLLVVQLVLQALLVAVGYYFAATPGVISGLVLAQWLLYPFYAAVYSRLKLWQPEVDIPLLILAAGLTAITIHYNAFLFTPSQ